MWISKKKWSLLEQRVSALEKAEKERRDLAQYRKEHGSDALKEARQLLRSVGK